MKNSSVLLLLLSLLSVKADNSSGNWCRGNDFRCQNGKCILSSWKCDRRDDCGDNSDEIGCPAPTSCVKDQFSCGSGECIPSLWRCDGENDCIDSSDETQCQTTTCDAETELRCDYGQCIPKSWFCDGVSDCYDATDERNCTKVLICTSHQLSCDNKRKCIDKTSICNLKQDCEDGSDEKNCSVIACSEGRYWCGNSTVCLYTHEVCDGHIDCPEGDDEYNCTRSTKECTDKEYFCTYNSRCIAREWLCDGDNDCGDGEDEKQERCHQNPLLPVFSHPLPVKCDEFSCGLRNECIHWSKVCDGKKDCRDGIDEGDLCSKSCATGNGGCSQKCQKTPYGPKCFCYDGYNLASDNVTCVDVNECDIPGICSQFCNNTQGSFKCSCADGYFLDLTGKCKAVEGPATLLYLLPGQIKGIHLGSGATKEIFKEDSIDIRGMDYDASDGKIFFSERSQGTINHYNPETKTKDILFTTTVRPEQLRWDWITKNMYFTDAGGNIHVCILNGTYCSTLISEVPILIHGFDISPTTGFMFWSIWGATTLNSSSVIKRAELDGSHPTEVVTEGLVWPIAVTVDHVMKMIYWLDLKQNVIECADFYGLKRRTVAQGVVSYLFSMAVFEDFVYWSHWGTDSIIRCNKFGGHNCIEIHKRNSKAEALIIMHKAQQPKDENRCLNSGCPQLCVLTFESFACKCDYNFQLVNSACVANTTDDPMSTSESVCPESLCPSDTECVIIDEIFVCQSLTESPLTTYTPNPDQQTDVPKDAQVKSMKGPSLLKAELGKIPMSLQPNYRVEEDENNV